jgi:NitT/TauT family transport system permease protein
MVNRYHFFQLMPGLLVLLLWEFVSRHDSRLEFLFASPSSIIAVAAVDLASVELWQDIALTATEALLGLVCGALVGTVSGLLLWTNETLARVARPYVVLLGAVPIFAIAPMLIIWFGTGLLSKVVMAAFSVFFVSLAQAYDGARFCSQEYALYATALRVPRLRFVGKIVVPGALRWVIAGLKISVGLALVGAFIGEFVSSQAGLGHYITRAGTLYDMPRVLFGVFLVSTMALIMTGFVWGIERIKPELFVR